MSFAIPKPSNTPASSVSKSVQTLEKFGMPLDSSFHSVNWILHKMWTRVKSCYYSEAMSSVSGCICLYRFVCITHTHKHIQYTLYVGMLIKHSHSMILSYENYRDQTYFGMIHYVTMKKSIHETQKLLMTRFNLQDRKLSLIKQEQKSLRIHSYPLWFWPYLAWIYK